ncbi:MAG: lipocalin-like domain-containing protein [Bacteroidaceae bacterium]|nr:lipocalin-like domain-containing protein [Bacteroidaceae bacterium]
MKKILVLFMAALLAGCAKAPINGVLDGMWQLTRIEKADGSVSEQKNVFWAFQLHLMMLGDQRYYCRFTNSGGEMRIYDIASGSSHVEGDDDKPITEAQLKDVAMYGLYKLDTTFKIERLDDDGMVLKSDDARLTFRKY